MLEHPVSIRCYHKEKAMGNYQLVYERPHAVNEDLSVNPSVLGFRLETVEFAAKNHRAAEEWVDGFTGVGTARIRDPKPLFRQYGKGEPFDPKPEFIEVPKRRPLLLGQVLKKW